jgi:hypothetical protein
MFFNNLQSVGQDTNKHKPVFLVVWISLNFLCACFKFMVDFTGFSMVSDSQGPTDFSAHLGFSEDSNSQSSEPSTKRLKTD